MTKIDVLIITALKIEYDAAKSAALVNRTNSWGITEWLENKDNPNTPYIFGEYVATGFTFNIALARPTRMGGTATAPIAASLIEQLKPKCLAMCGVCAGNPGDVALGDVIIAEMAYAYDEGKRKADGFEGDHRQIPMDEVWVRNAQDLKPNGLSCFGESSEEESNHWLLERLYFGDDPKHHLARPRYFSDNSWAERIKSLENDGLIVRQQLKLSLTDKGRSFIEEAIFYNVQSPSKLPFQISVGPITSGNVVVKDGVTWDSLKQWGVRSVLGLEMEAATIAHTAHRLAVPKWIVAKGVMDYADPKKDDRYKPFAARASAEVLFMFLATQFEPIGAISDLCSKGALASKNIENIFQTSGALSSGHKTYINRDCDNDLKESLTKKNLIALIGEFQIGKSSLLNQIDKYLNIGSRIFYFDVMGKRTDDPNLFVTGFFRALNSQLYTNINTWDELAKVSTIYPIVILIDEFGALGNKKETAIEFIPRIIHLAINSNIQIVVNLPSSSGSIEDFIKSQDIPNPKFWDSWKTIVIEPFKDREVLEILSLLPEEVFLITKGNLEIIISKSNRNPKSLQCLCRNLFNKYNNGIIGNELTELINQDDSYI